MEPLQSSILIVFQYFRSDQKLSLVGNPGQLLKPLHTETMSCEYISLELLDKWIICMFLDSVMLLWDSFHPVLYNAIWVNENIGTSDIFCYRLCLSFVVGFLLCHHKLGSDQGHKMWISALENSWVIALFRDEVIYIHSYIQTLFDSMKGYSKRISEVKDCYSHAIQKA